MALRAVFLDLDGVLVDPAKLGPEYVRLLGEVLAPALGGTAEEWGRANAETFPRLFDRLTNEVGHDTPPGDAYRMEYVENVRMMCDVLGRPAPDGAECERLGREFNVYVRGHSRSPFPGAARCVRTLAASYAIHLATGNPSWTAEAVLRQLGVSALIGLPCGPDLVGVLKRSPLFYLRLFERAGVRGMEAVVVDDSPAQLAMAADAGAATVLVAPGGAPAGLADAVVEGVEDVAGAVLRLGRQVCG